MALEKGTEEWMFWSDFFQLCKKYWDIHNSEDYWRSLANATNELYNKYKSDYAEVFIMAFVNLQERKAKNKE